MPSVLVCYHEKSRLWAPGRDTAELYKYCRPGFRIAYAALNQPRRIGHPGNDIVLSVNNSKAILELCKSFMRSFGSKSALVAIHPLGPGHEVERLLTSLELADHVVVNNEAMWKTVSGNPKITWISNGVDLDDFRVTVPTNKRKPKVIWTASNYRLEHKGYPDILVPLGARLASAGIDHDFHVVTDVGGSDWKDTNALRDWYNSGTIFVCASKTEGTPNTALEAAACGCVPVTPPVGNMPELIRDGENGYLVERSIDGLWCGIQRAIANYERLSSKMLQDIQGWSWKERTKQYFDLFRRLIDERRAKGG